MCPKYIRRRAAALVLALVAVALSPSAASAISIGTGSQPGLAVDPSGTAYIAWMGPSSSLEFCRLPRSATACDVRHPITAFGASVHPPFVFVSGTRVVVVQYRYPTTNGQPDKALYSYTSTDGGATFGGENLVGSLALSDAVAGPGDTLSGVAEADAQNGAFQNVALDGSPPDPIGRAQLWGDDHPYSGAVGLIGAATPLAIFATPAGAAQFRRYSGTGSVNDQASWTAPADVGVVAYARLASGPSGLFLLTTNRDGTLVSRKWNGTTFGADVPISAGVNAPSMHAYEDAAGRLHVVFQRGGPLGERRLVHAVSDDGATWRSGTVTATVAASDDFEDTRVAAAADHIGVVAWTGVNATGSDVRVAAIGPDAPVDPVVTPVVAPVVTKAPTPATTVLKRKPRLTARGGARRRASRFQIRITGKLILPSGVSAAAGCRGTIKIKIARARKTIIDKTVRVGPSCAYALTANVRRSAVQRAKRLNVTLSYSGSATLTSAKKTGRLNVKR